MAGSGTAATIINCAASACDQGSVEMTFFPRATGWGTADAGAHAARMQAALPAFVRRAVQDTSSRVRTRSAPFLSARPSGYI